MHEREGIYLGCQVYTTFPIRQLVFASTKVEGSRKLLRLGPSWVVRVIGWDFKPFRRLRRVVWAEERQWRIRFPGT